MLTQMGDAWRPRDIHEIPLGRLESAGLRATWMRLLLIDLFEQTNSELSCDEVYRLLLQAGVEVSLSTTYSNVRRLAKEGVLVAGEPRHKIRVCATFALPDIDCI